MISVVYSKFLFVGVILVSYAAGHLCAAQTEKFLPAQFSPVTYGGFCIPEDPLPTLGRQAIVEMSTMDAAKNCAVLVLVSSTHAATEKAVVSRIAEVLRNDGSVKDDAGKKK